MRKNRFPTSLFSCLSSIARYPKEPAQPLKLKAVTSGRALIQLLRGEEFAKGNFYNFVPTRNYIRACKIYASYLLHLGKNKEAYNKYQECLTNDIHVKLGARHGQLLAL